MPNNKYDYTIKISAEIKNLKKDIKSELASVLREVDNVGDAVSKGITPDTKEFESKIASLESKMEKLATSSKDVEQQVASMKTAFKGFTELEASMKVIGEQNKEMYETFVKMTPYIQEFAKTFAAMKPEQAVAAMTGVISQMNTSGQAGSKAFKDMQSTMNSVVNSAKEVKSSIHEVETATTGTFNAEANTIETRVNNASKVADEAKRKASEAEAELRRIQTLSSKNAYKGIKDSDDDAEHSKFIDEIDRLEQIANVDYSVWTQLKKGTEGYDAALKKAAESAANFLSILENVKNTDERALLKDENYASSIENADIVLDSYTSGLKEASIATQELQKVSLKPLKLKIDLSTDDELISQINKAIERIQGNTKINPLKIPLDFIDVGEEEIQQNNKKKKKTKNVKTTTENGTQKEVEVDSRLGSVAKEIKSLQDSFDKIKTPLLNDIKEWRHNLEEYLTLEFKWKKGDTEGVSQLFDDINDYAEQHPIWLNPDTDKLITEIESALTQHQFKLNINGSEINIPGNFIGGFNNSNSNKSSNTKKNTKSQTPSSTTTKSETEKDTASVDKNSQAVEKNSDVISDVVNEFKTYAQKTNEAIARSTKTIERLTAQNEKLDKNKPEDAEQIAANQSKIKKEQTKINTNQSRMKALSSVTGIDVQNVNNMDNDALVEAVTNLVQDRNEIVNVINSTKIGGASDGKVFLTKGIKNIANSIKTAQESLNIEMKSADQVSQEIAAKDYLNDAEQLSRMGLALKTVNREIRNNVAPTTESLQQVANVFSGIGKDRYKSRNLNTIVGRAQNLQDVLNQYDEVFSSDGGYQQYINRLNDEISQLQSEIDELSTHPRKNKSTIAEKKGQLGVKQFELDSIQSEVEPVLNAFKESIKGLSGQIFDQLKGYKLIVEFVDANGKEVVESFNDPSARAPTDTKTYWKSSNQFFDRVRAGTITKITPTGVINDSPFNISYGDKISKTEAIQQVIDKYNQLDKKAKEYVDTLIDINKLTDENLSVSQKFDYLENSYVFDRDNKEGIKRSKASTRAFEGQELSDLRKQIRSNLSKLESLDSEKNSNEINEIVNETKALQENIRVIKQANEAATGFFEAVTDSYFNAVASVGTSKGKQSMLIRGSSVSYGVSKNATVAHPEEREYSYSSSNRAYRTPYDAVDKSLDEYKADLMAVSNRLNTTQTKVDEYNASLESAKNAHQQEKEKLDIAQQERNTLRVEYEKNGINSENFAEYYSSIKDPEELQKFESAFMKELNSLFVEEKKRLQSDIDELRRLHKSGKIEDKDYYPQVTELVDQRLALSNKINEFETILSPYDDDYRQTVSQLNESLQTSKAQLESLEQEKSKIEQKIYNIENGISEPSLGTPVESGSEEAKAYALREINIIEEDLQLADKKIAAAEEKSKDYEDRIKTLKRKEENASEVKKSQSAATEVAYRDAKDSKEYKDFQEKTYQQFKNQSITWDQYLERTNAKADELVAKLKEANPGKYTGKSYTELIDILSKQKEIYDNQIKQENAYKQQLQSYRQEAMAFGQITEEELANQRAITEEKKEQVQATQQEKTVQTEKTTSKKKDTKSTSALSDKQREAFTEYVSQVKANELKKSASVKDVDLSEAINMQKQLNALAEQGNQNTEEYLILQKKLSDLISKNVNQLQGTGRNGYATSAEKYDWLKSNVSEDVANFYSSDEYAASNKKFDAAVANKLGKSLVEGFSDSFITQCLDAAQTATQTAKDEGKKSGQVRSAVVKVVKKELDGYKEEIAEGVEQGVKESASETKSKKTSTKQDTNRQTDDSSSTQLGIGQLVIQADNVIVNGNTVASSGDGSGPWALETSLLKTNEILNSISGKIDSVKGSSGSSNDSPASGGEKKKKKEEEIDVNAIRQRLESEAADNRKRFSIDGLEDSIKSVQKFDEKTLKLYETFTLANGEAVKFTYSLNAMDGTIKSSYTTIANFEGVAKKAYTELGKSQIATKQLFEGFNFPQDKITAYNNAIAALDNKLKGLGENGITDPKDANEVEVLTGNVKKLRTEIENMVKASEKTANSGTLVKKFNAGEVDNIKASMKALAEEIPNASLAASNFNDKTNELTFTVKTGKNELTTLTYKFDELTQSVYETGRASKTTTGFFKSFFSDVGTKVAELARYYTGMSLLTEGLQQVRRGVQYVREIDLALTELKKVTDETENAYRKFLQTASQTSKVIGSTVADFTNATADFARLGYTISEAAKLAEASSIYKNVGDGIESVADASESIISTMKAFGIAAEDAMGIVDRFNEVGNNFAISSTGIGEALQRSASALYEGGNTIDEAIGLITAAMENWLFAQKCVK